MTKYIIIPTYNEVDNLPKVVKQIFDLRIPDLNIIVVDDNSTDGTGRLADKLSSEYPLTVIHRSAKLGLGSAYIAGFKQALDNNAELIFEMDADLSHDPKDLPRFIKEFDHNCDLVIGSRRISGGNVQGWSPRRNLQSKAAMSFARLILGLKTKDITAGFRCYGADSLRQIDFDNIKSNSYAFQEEMVYYYEKKGFIVKEIPVTFIDRQFGHSKLGLKDIMEFFITIFRLRFR